MAGKRTHLTNAELYYIRGNPDNLTPNELADELNVSLKRVQAVVYEKRSEDKKAAKKEEEENPTPVRKPNLMKGMIIQDTSDQMNPAKKTQRVAAMTPAGSQMIDELSKNSRAAARKGTNQPHLAPTFPNGKDE